MYGKIHRFFLRSIASRGVISLNDAQQILTTFTDEELSSVQDLVKEINDEIRPLQQAIKITNDELTNEEVVIFLSLGYDDATKSQNIFNATELEYFRVLIEQIMTTEARQITGIHAINLVGGMKASFTKTDAQKLLNTWCRMRYLDKDQNNYALGVRAIHEFEGYLRQNMPDTIEECCLCKQIVFRGCNCLSCGQAVHTRCLNKYLEKVEKWPCCKADFSAEQLEQLRCAEVSRLSQTQQIDLTQQNEDNSSMLQTQQSTEDITTQDIIPEISQRVTRKRKRHCE
ncbi:non-structural maintenance of chromosomes element 1 homolog [Ostrinia furnacalis]|uniref:non-structural maintenance of chromosomes element 1 homolog n=1 Tax=Ostrinia furnacalis TaxID=93504 RepID=UPI00103FBB17|nr:non-structural maintenance of chromosomes element 1 homolog [Ostrinia furnacalis]